MTGFWLKMLAALCMLADHMEVILFPEALWLRCIGRLSFPIFAYFIAEGYRYTHSFRAYFLRIFAFAVLFQAGYAFSGLSFQLSIFVTFSLSLLIMRLCDLVREAAGERKEKKTVGLFLLLLLLILGCFFLCRSVFIDYGFFGILTPPVLSLFRKKSSRLAALSVCLFFLCIDSHFLSGVLIQAFAFAALIPLAFYNGKPGRYRLKYFFYFFYPVHLLLLSAIALLLGRYPAG